jgi:hopanoid biosynthesis associated protein HpnK
MSTQLILNADDFGASAEVNAAVARARRDGVLTSASLMVTGERVAEAVDIAREDGALAIGLHLTLSNGVSLLPADEVPLLVDENQHFADSPALAGLHYYFDGRTRRQLRREIEAQFLAFARTGLRLSHVDGHQHLHLHPTVLPIVIELAAQYGASGLRMPCEPLLPSVSIDRSRIGRRTVVACGHSYLRSGRRGQLARAGLASCDAAVGSLVSGSMSTDYVIAMLSRLKCESIEVFFHPSEEDSGDPCGPNRGDLETLLDPRLRDFIEQQRYERTSYAVMREKVDVSGLA